MLQCLKKLAGGMALVLMLALPALAAESNCISCHKKVTPNIVKDFLEGEMGKSGSVDCFHCHGKEHQSAKDVAKVTMPTEKTCKQCHTKEHDQYASGKHAMAWVAMDAMPTN
ncbi:Hydroxylamine oxidoreductase [Citrifermentans bremense]|nr:multiheme c-type cytochrome [Citrifermentans bremense]BCG48817.1 Hydroxylamine oxidoreductase [Citrifermentans bremense]